MSGFPFGELTGLALVLAWIALSVFLVWLLLVWVLFPILVCQRLDRITKELGRVNASLDRISRSPGEANPDNPFR